MEKLIFFLGIGLFLVGCGTVTIKDEQWCSPIPIVGGASCDNMFTSAPQTMTPDQWDATIASWESDGEIEECTRSNTLGDIKAELEKLCSVSTCDYPTQQAIAQITTGIAKIQALRKPALH